MVKQEQEFTEMQHCLFQPHMISNPEKIDRDTKLDQVVSGVQNYIENKDYAAKLKHDQLIREKQLYDYVSKYDKRDHTGITVATPFTLSKVN
jgi:hypothetical protein